MFSLIVIQDEAGGIGTEEGIIPFANKADLANFKRLTHGNIVIMGRKTHESIGRTLQGRLNIIISSNPQILSSNDTSVFGFNSVKACVAEVLGPAYRRDRERFVIGGEQIYRQFLELGLIDKMYISTVKGDYNCSVKMPTIDYTKFEKIKQEQHKGCVLTENVHYQEYKYVNVPELEFLDLLRDIMYNGNYHMDRTLIGTKSLAGQMLEFDLSNNQFPLGTTKKVPLNKVFEELMWILRGDTNTKTLSAKGIKVWEPNSSRAFLDSQGLTHYKEGDIGPCYGFAVRHYGAEYKGCDADYTGLGFDQLKYVVDLLKNNPTSRRIMINLWNPAVLDQVALPPCLFCYQFYVRVTPQGKYLTCLMDQRSSDISLAGFWNIATGALLTYLLAQVTGCIPEMLKWCIKDAHIYMNQFEAVKQQLEREPRMFPRLMFTKYAPSLANGRDITEFEYTDLILMGYNPYSAIKNVLNP